MKAQPLFSIRGKLFASFGVILLLMAVVGVFGSLVQDPQDAALLAKVQG